MVILDRELQLENANSSITVTLSGIVTYVSKVLLENAPYPIDVTVSGILHLLMMYNYLVHKYQLKLHRLV